MLLKEIKNVVSFNKKKEEKDEQKRWKRYHELGIVDTSAPPKPPKKK